jgi:hypothetical protein
MRRAAREGSVGWGPRWAVAAAGIALSLALGCGPRGSEQDVDVATRLATEFLRALDGDPASTWRELAEPLRARVPEAQWPEEIARMRAPLGKPVARELASAAFSEELADAPPGPYFAVEFDSQFSEAACGERVVLLFERGRWRVVGYFVRNTRPRGARLPAHSERQGAPGARELEAR